MSEVLTIDARIAAPPERVYAALTDAGALRVWLAEHAEVSLPEGRYEFWGRYTPQGERGRQWLVEAEPGRALRFGWRLDDQETTASFTLAADGDGTKVKLEQTGVPTVEQMMAHTGRRDGLHSLHTFWSLAVGTLAEYAEGRELTPKADFSPDRPLEIRAEVTVDDAPEAVFRSLTDPETVRRWFGWPVEIEPRVGGKVTLGADGEITEFEPGRVFVYVDGEMVTRWELEGSGGRTRLTFVQSGFTEAERDSAAQHEAGWLQGLAELKRLHATGGEPPRGRDLPGREG
ncbi:SRPBCC family protein [Amycolatopsis suaedae]|uniref:SRPBCC domain-containing protein n=1 Tax=Amycolatopsis suaedae TaxID=2510978 RepID=A0A4Q7JEJ1_9PSEU|nr:SRPBCC domain-containing protein [Amycolatopsis suaedae]RZQ65576.1 SRPBCC domain-containing protein [Amycolatopsis suaedae]